MALFRVYSKTATSREQHNFDTLLDAKDEAQVLALAAAAGHGISRISTKAEDIKAKDGEKTAKKFQG